MYISIRHFPIKYRFNTSPISNFMFYSEKNPERQEPLNNKICVLSYNKVETPQKESSHPHLDFRIMCN